MQPTLLIADDDPDVIDLLVRRCESIGFRVDTATNAMTALGKIEETPPDVVVLDVGMPQGNGLSVCEMMASHEELREIPCVILTGNTNRETVRRCHELCAYYVLKCTDLWTRLEPLLNELYTETVDGGAATRPSREQAGAQSATPSDDSGLIDSVFAVIGAEEGDSLSEQDGDTRRWSDQPWVLSVEDDDDFALALRLRLEEYGFQVIRAGAGREGYRRAFFSKPRAIILDYELPEGNGDYVLRRLKESPATAQIPVIVLTGRAEGSVERRMRALGAEEFLTKPLNWKRLKSVLEITLDAAALSPETRGEPIETG